MRAALYARVSTLNGQHPQMQLRELTEHVTRRGWEIMGEYVDEGVSGSKESRPELNRLMADAHRRLFDIVLVWKIDRFGRSLKHLVNALADLDSYGVTFASLKDSLDLSTPSGRLMFQIIGAMAEFERALIQERVKAGLQNARRTGWRGVGFPRNAAKFVTQNESILSLAEGETGMMVEANVWGMLFYGTDLDTEINLKSTSISGIHLYRLVGHLLVFTEHANQMTSRFGGESPLSFDVTLSDILGIPWFYSQGDMGGIYEGPKSPLDDEFSFSLPTTSEELRKRPDALVMSMLQHILFAMNWSDYVNKPAGLESLLRTGYKCNSWGEPTVLRL